MHSIRSSRNSDQIKLLNRCEMEIRLDPQEDDVQKDVYVELTRVKQESKNSSRIIFLLKRKRYGHEYQTKVFIL